MLKPFCDICGSEITDNNKGMDRNRGVIEIENKVNLKIVLMHDDIEICKYCICSQVGGALDDRPTSAVKCRKCGEFA